MWTREDTISSRDYTRLCALIYAEAGIHLGGEKRTMLEMRIRRRLKELEIGSYGEYCEYLFGPRGKREEVVSLIDVVTTNKTDFFREPRHFEILSSQALAEMSERACGKPLLLWSAGCSTGEEPYTLAMVLSEYALAHPGFRFRILATDISTTVLDKAVKGIYSQAVVEPVPEMLKRRYLLRSRDRSHGLVRVTPELRRLVEFRRLNLMDADYGIYEKADAVFCRNVMIYFDRPTQVRILGKIVRQLVPGGYLFMGHAESLLEMDLPLTSVAPALYRRNNAA